MSCCKKFWLEDPKYLFNSIQLIPYDNMNLAEQLNIMTRIVLIMGIIMLLFNFRHGIYFTIISVIIIIIIYYSKKNTMKTCKENYTPTGTTYSPASIKYFQPYNSPSVSKTSVIQNVGTTLINTGEPLPFCNDYVSIDPPSPFAVGLNQSLAVMNKVDSNPVTKIKPVVVSPSHDLESWRDNNLIIHSHINSAGIQQEMYLSGYAESTCCDYLPDGTELVPDEGPKIQTVVGGRIPKNYTENYGARENYCPGSIVSPTPVDDRPFIPTVPVKENYRNNFQNRENYCPGSIVSPTPVDDRPFIPTVPVKENYRNKENYCPGSIVSPTPVDDRPFIPTVPVRESYNSKENYRNNFQSRENYELTTVDSNNFTVQPNRSGWVNTTCGYNPEQVNVGLPSNFPAGNCDQDPAMKQYNENLFTQIVTPGTYSRNQVNEPINSNIGISFTQQLEPVTCKRDEKGLQYLLHDPRIIEPAEETPVEIFDKANYDNVYDPRFYGYGTSYRSYLEPVTGQTRFMYEDVNAIRMPNYVVRSNVDHLAYADHYGPMQAGSEMGNIHNPHIRYLAQDSWMRDSLQFREDLSQSRMRKINAEGWQKRMYPNSNRPVGSAPVYKR